MRLIIVSLVMLTLVDYFSCGPIAAQQSVVIRNDIVLKDCRSIMPHQSDIKHDPWFAGDKLLHFSGSLFLYTGSYLMQKEAFGVRKPSLSSAGITFTAGLGKELYDRSRPPNFFSWKDMLWNCAGIGAGMILINFVES